MTQTIIDLAAGVIILAITSALVVVLGWWIGVKGWRK